MSIPQKIKDLATKVRNEIYGKDVRESIAKSMEVTGETAEEAKDRSIEQTDRVDRLIRDNPQPSEVVDARGNHNLLGDRFNSVETDLAQTVKLGQNETITKSMLAKDIKEEINNGQIEFILNTSEIEDDAMTEYKTSYIEPDPQRDLCIHEIRGNGVWSELPGDVFQWNDNVSYTAVIAKVKPNTEYMIGRYWLRCVGFDSNNINDNFFSDGMANKATELYFSHGGSSTTPEQIITDGNTHFLVLITATHLYETPDREKYKMVVEGSEYPTEYLEPRFILRGNIDILNHVRKVDFDNKVNELEDQLDGLVTYGLAGLVLGDSNTATQTIDSNGELIDNPEQTKWVTYSKEYLKLGNVYNYAVGGAAFRERSGVTTYQYMKNQIELAISKNKPIDFVVVAAAVNDWDEYAPEEEFNAALDMTDISSADMTKVYQAIRWSFWRLRQHYADKPCFYGVPIQTAKDTKEDYEFLQRIKIIAQMYNFIIIDAWSESGIVKDFEVWEGNGRYLHDGLHANTSGKKLMSKLYNRVILNTMKHQM